MDLNVVKLSLIRDKNTAGIQIIEKIEKIVKDYDISINKAITYCLNNCKGSYEKRLLSICRSIYPYDGQINLKSLIKSNPISSSNTDKIYYTVGKYTEDANREVHEEDSSIKEFPIGVSENKIYNTSNLKYQNFKVQAEIIDPQTIEQPKRQTKKTRRKLKARID